MVAGAGGQCNVQPVGLVSFHFIVAFQRDRDAPGLIIRQRLGYGLCASRKTQFLRL